MADVKWIKMSTSIFDNRKIRIIESLPEGNAVIVIWLKLLCLAGNINDCGMVYFTKEIPYTEQMLSTQFNTPLTTIQSAIKTFEQFGMIEIINDMLHISNWEKYQNVEGMDKIREQNRIRKQKQRERQKLLLEENSHVTSRDGHATEEDKEEEKNKIRIEEEKKAIDYQNIVNMYNDTCVSLPTLSKLTDSRKRAIKARLKDNSLDVIKKVFEKAEASDFLKGLKNTDGRNWTANFDFLMKEANFIKTLEGNYDNTNSTPKLLKNTNKFNDFEQREYSDEELDDLERKLLSR